MIVDHIQGKYAVIVDYIQVQCAVTVVDLIQGQCTMIVCTVQGQYNDN